jgi:hypothetical protein
MSTIAIANLRIIDITTLTALGTCQQFRLVSALSNKSPLRANSGHPVDYSINSSARPIRVFGMLRPSDLAVLRLITNSVFVAC